MKRRRPTVDDLKQAGDLARIENLAALRDDFVTPWVAWNIVRTLALTAAFGCLAWALALRGTDGGARGASPLIVDAHDRVRR